MKTRTASYQLIFTTEGNRDSVFLQTRVDLQSERLKSPEEQKKACLRDKPGDASQIITRKLTASDTELEVK